LTIVAPTAACSRPTATSAPTRQHDDGDPFEEKEKFIVRAV